MPSRSAAPGADSQGLQSHQWSHARPTPFTASRCPRHPAAHVAPPEASPHRAAEPAPPTTLPKVINKGAAPRPPRPWHQHEADPGAQKQKYAQNCNFFAIANCREASKRGLTPGKAANRTHSGPFPPRGGRKGVRNRKKSCTEVGIFVSAKRIVATEQFLRKTRVPSMPIRPSSSTEPQRIDHTSTHALTLGKDPPLARLKNATSEEKRWQNKPNSRKLLKASSLQSFEGRTWGSIVNNWSNTTLDCYKNTMLNCDHTRKYKERNGAFFC